VVASTSVTPQRRRLARLALLAVFFVALLVVGHHFDLASRLSPDKLRAQIVSAGAWGVALYVAAFTVGELVHVPGLVFIAAAVLAYGRVWGGLLGWSASLIALTVTFFFARAVGGTPLAEVKNARIRRILSRLDTNPLLTMFVLRMVFTLSAWLNYGLALSGVRYRDYILASALGLIVPITLASIFFDAMPRLFGWS
jgi:uncharacterized membrane protein YdjX (TVP38/TMEM64 family)